MSFFAIIIQRQSILKGVFMTTPVYGLVFHAYQEHSHHQLELIFASTNEMMLRSLCKRLSVFCHSDEHFSVQYLSIPSKDNELCKDGFYHFISEENSDYNFHHRHDFLKDVFELPKKLGEDQYINKIEVVDTPKLNDINMLCSRLWSFNDFHKQYALYHRIERYKRDGSFYQKENEDLMKYLVNLL